MRHLLVTKGNFRSMDFMRIGGNALNRGDTAVALLYFNAASRQSTDKQEAASALQLAGVCYRILGDFCRADTSFKAALDRLPADNERSRGKIYRDWASVAVAEHKYELAVTRLEQALELLQSNGDPLIGDDRSEYWITAVKLNEAHYLNGDYGRAQAANSATIYRELEACSNETYKLNALFCILPTQRYYRVRRVIAKRALPLARKAGHVKRMRQIRLFVFCPPWLYRLIRSR